MKWLGRLINLFDNRKQRNYVSEADRVLEEFNRNHPELSESQKHEINKHKDIFYRPRKKRIDWS